MTKTLGFLIGLLLLASSATATNRYVCAAGNSSCGGTPAYTTTNLALAAAVSGDTIYVKYGETHNYITTLPNKGTLASAIRIRSTAPDASLPPAGGRIDPSYAAFMPILKSDTNNTATIGTAVGASDYIIGPGLRIQCDDYATAEGISLGENQSTQQFAADQPKRITVDRVYVEGDTIKGCRRGVSLHGATLSVIGSYITKINAPGADSQGIWGANGWGPYLIENNHIDSATMGIMFGGTDNQIRTTCVVQSMPAPTTTAFTCGSYRATHTSATLNLNTQRIAVVTGATSYHRYVSNVTSDRYTMTVALPTAPTVGSTVYWGAMPSDITIRGNEITKLPNWYLPPLGTPTIATGVASQASGSLTAGTYYYRVQALATGQGGSTMLSTASLEKAVTLTGTGSAVLTWGAVTSASSYRIYGRSSGGQNCWFTVSAPTVTYTDTGASCTGTGSIGAGSLFQFKNGMELKEGIRVLIEKNIIENSRSSAAGTGGLIWLKDANQDDASPFSELTDVTLRYNWIRHGAGAIELSSAEENAAGTTLAPPAIEDIKIYQNVFSDIGLQWTYDGEPTMLINIADYNGRGMNGLLLEHNTFTSGVWHTIYFTGTGSLPAATDTIRDNAFPSTTYGIRADGYNGGSDVLTAFGIETFTNNIVAGAPNVYPATTLRPSAAAYAASFVNSAGTALTDFAWVPGSPYATGAHDGTAIGADITALAGYLAGVPSGVITNAPVFNTSTLTDGTVGAPYSVQLSASSGTAPLAFTLVSGTLPTGVTLSSSGLLSGTPTVAGTSSGLKFRVTDAAPLSTDSATLSLMINAAAASVTITTSSLPAGDTAQTYNQTLSASGGNAVYQWTVSAGTMPPGITLVGNILTGRPTASGIYTFSLTVTSGASVSAPHQYSITVAAAGSTTTPQNPSPRNDRQNGVEIWIYADTPPTTANRVKVRDLYVDAQGALWAVTSTAGSVTLQGVGGYRHVAIQADNSETIVPAPAGTPLPTNFEVRVYLASGPTQCRIHTYVSDATISGAKLALQYYDGDSWEYLDGGTGPSVAVDTTGVKDSAFVTLAAAAQNDVPIRAFVTDGDSSNNLILGNVSMECR